MKLHHLFLIFATIGLLFTTTASLAQDQLTEEIKAPEIMVTKFYADWCGSCKEMKPAFDAFLNATEEEPTLYVHFDLTDDQTRQKSAYLAHSMGLSDIYKANAGKTGYALLVDADSKKVLDRLTKEMSKDQMLNALSEAMDKL